MLSSSNVDDTTLKVTHSSTGCLPAHKHNKRNEDITKNKEIPSVQLLVGYGSALPWVELHFKNAAHYIYRMTGATAVTK